MTILAPNWLSFASMSLVMVSVTDNRVTTVEMPMTKPRTRNNIRPFRRRILLKEILWSFTVFLLIFHGGLVSAVVDLVQQDHLQALPVKAFHNGIGFSLAVIIGDHEAGTVFILNNLFYPLHGR